MIIFELKNKKKKLKILIVKTLNKRSMKIKKKKVEF